MRNVIQNTLNNVDRITDKQEKINSMKECILECRFQMGQITGQLASIAWEDLSRAEKNILVIVTDKSLDDLKAGWKQD
jgi:hypothetical protein